jgi:RNA-directed DNA polymerase
MKPTTEEITVTNTKICDKDHISSLPLNIILLRQKLATKANKETKFKFYSLYGIILRRDVLETAWKLVLKNRGCPGIDGVSFEMIIKQENGVQNLIDEIELELRSKTYKPLPIRRVYIPKQDGKLRPLGIPCIKDRIVQMATLLVLEPIFDEDFMDCSYGFRPGRSAHEALHEISSNIKQGKVAIYDADMKGYFDSIPHDKLMACVNMRVTDRSVLKLIRMWLKAPIIEPPKEKGKPSDVIKPTKGTPQGGVISPLLANLYLHWFDVVFHGKDGPEKFANASLIRYADDFVIMAKFQGYRIKEFAQQRLEGWLGLEINYEKTKTVNLNKEGESFDFLGYNFRKRKAKTWNKSRCIRTYLHPAPKAKSVQSAKLKIRELTSSKHCCKPITEVIDGINSFIKGWKGYFRFGYPYEAYCKIDYYVYGRLIQHLRRRSQRAYKKPKGMSYYKHFKRLGLCRLTGYG